ncbi:MAG: hypothetical protein WCQ96_05815 [Patescibacteria group bacterium]|jgi:hypothetical protein
MTEDLHEYWYNDKIIVDIILFKDEDKVNISYIDYTVYKGKRLDGEVITNDLLYVPDGRGLWDSGMQELTNVRAFLSAAGLKQGTPPELSEEEIK